MKQTAVEQLVVTFTCNNYVHVYNKNSGVLPMFPYKKHSTVDDAIKYLKEKKDVDNPKVIMK